MTDKDDLELTIIIKDTPIFRTASNDEIMQIIEMSEIKEYENSETIIEENSTEGALYIILDGKVEMKKVFDEERKITELTKGDFFGEISLFDQKPHPVTSISVGNTKMLVISYPSLRGLMVINKRLAHNIYTAVLQMQSKLLRESNERMKKFLEDTLT